MNKFDVLGTMRAIRDDHSLTTAQAHLLMCAVLRTDNTSMKVRYSVELLAEDANMTRKTAGIALKDPGVRRYFAKIERTKRTVNLWFADVKAPEWVVTTHSEGLVELKQETPDEPSGYQLPTERVVVTHSVGSDYPPSTSIYPSSTSTGDSAAASSPNHKTDGRLGKGKYNYFLTNPLNRKANPEPVYLLELPMPTTEPEWVTTTHSDLETKQARARAFNAARRKEEESTVERIEDEW